MPELIVHDLIQHDTLKKWIVFTNDDVMKNYKVVFGEQGVINLKKAMIVVPGDFYEIKRYFQFVGIVRYKKDMGMLTMNIFECENINQFLDGFLELEKQSWKTTDLNNIGSIIQQILSDNNKKLATIRLNKLL